MRTIVKNTLTLAAALAIAVASPAFAETVTPAKPQAYDTPASLADLVDKLSPAVVNVSTTQKMKPQASAGQGPFGDLPDTPEFEPFRQFFDQLNRGQGGGGPNGGGRGNNNNNDDREMYSLGSGFIIDATGFIITNNHVIDAASEINVTLSDNTKYKATLVGRDKKTDLALLKIDVKKDLPFVTLGDSDAMRVGDWVIAIGNPYGLGGSVTQGIISARQRSINAGPFDDFLQTDAPINRGNSGGPLFNMKGEVIGINTAIFSPSGGSIGIGFAVPTTLAKTVISQLKESGHTTRGWLGVKIQEVSDEAAESMGLPKVSGALILDVTKDSPADKAGIKAGDVITSFDAKDITAMRFLPRIVAETKIGKKVDVTYFRAGASKTTQITVGKLDESEDEAADTTADTDKPKDKDMPSEVVMGMRVTPLTTPVRDALNIDTDVAGVAIADVDHGTEASKRGIRRGDVVADVNGMVVKDAKDLQKAFADARTKGRKFAMLKIIRHKETAYVTLPTEEEKPEKKPEPKAAKPAPRPEKK